MNTDEEADEFRSYSLKEGVAWPNVFAGSTHAKLVRDWGVNGFPTTFVLDENGVIRAKGLRGVDLEVFVDDLVAELCAKSE